MREKIVAANWKMNMDAESAKALALAVSGIKTHRAQVVVCPPAIFIQSVSEVLSGALYAVGGQDVSAHEKGAYTGEVSALMLASAGAKYCIVGHSERRQYHGETDSDVATKCARLLANGIVPIVCVGESLVQRKEGNFMQIITLQITSALSQLSAEQAKQIVIAYEPVWAIGTGETATPEQAQEVHAAIREHLKSMFGHIADQIPLLYGGSCNASNAEALFSKPDIDGGLIGGASLKAADFEVIIQAANR